MQKLYETIATTLFKDKTERSVNIPIHHSDNIAI